MSGKSYEHHIIPRTASQPYGSYAIDQTPIATCKACHNMAGYSQTPLVRRVHGAHRGIHQLQPGVAHPDWDYPTVADPELSTFEDVLMPPAMYQAEGYPGVFETVSDGDGNEVNEKNCASCHADNRWYTNPTRVACGSCHDNVWFNSGTMLDGGFAAAGSLNPPRVVGPPSAGACAQDSDCSAITVFHQPTKCNATTGNCELRQHGGGPQSSDAACTVCHNEATGSLVPISAAHEIYSQTQTTGLVLTNVALSGNSQTDPDGGPVFMPGDTPTITFTLGNDAGVNTDLLTNTAYSATAVVGGPTNDRQRIAYAVLAPSTKATPGGVLTALSTPGSYSYVFPGPLPAVPLAPADQQFPIRATNQPGTYTLWLWIGETLTSGPGATGSSTTGVTFKDVADTVQNFEFGAPGPILPRQVILKSACNSCHVAFQHHGGQRTEPEECSICHTVGAVDGAAGLVMPLQGGAPVATKGVSCATNGDTDCLPNAAGNPAGIWLCYNPYPTRASTGGTGAACYMAVDPTPGPPIYFTNAGSVDPLSGTGTGVKGPACTAATEDTDCTGLDAGWEGCFESYSTTSSVPCSATSASCSCYVNVEPTPGQPVDFRVFIHEIHFARLRDGYAESNNLIVSPFVATDNLVPPGLMEIGTSANNPDNYSEILFPQDIRNCTMCHASTNDKCSASAPCGVGQTCYSPGTIGVASSGTCVNTAWQVPSAMVCTSCHDSQAAFAHVAAMTTPNPAGGPPLEACATCHGPNPDGTVGTTPDFSVAAVHNITTPYVPPYNREPTTPMP